MFALKKMLEDMEKVIRAPSDEERKVILEQSAHSLITSITLLTSSFTSGSLLLVC